MEGKQTAERGLDRIELLELLLSPLMSGQMPQRERIKKGFGEIRGLLKMTILGQMLVEDGREEGRVEGRAEGEGRVNQLILKLTAEKRYGDLERAAMDRAFQEELYAQ